MFKKVLFIPIIKKNPLSQVLVYLMTYAKYQ